MALQGAYFFEQLQRVKAGSDFAQFALDWLGYRRGLQEPFAGGLGWKVSLRDLRALPMFLRELE